MVLALRVLALCILQTCRVSYTWPVLWFSRVALSPPSPSLLAMSLLGLQQVWMLIFFMLKPLPSRSTLLSRFLPWLLPLKFSFQPTSLLDMETVWVCGSKSWDMHREIVSDIVIALYDDSSPCGEHSRIYCWITMCIYGTLVYLELL